MNQPFAYEPAGFWLRLGANLVDELICYAAWSFLILLPATAVGVTGSTLESAALLTAVALLPLLRWLYYTVSESASRGGTLGKIALGIKVTDLYGNRVSFGRANARYWGKIISALILGIGFLMAGFTDEKQALHDIIAGTLVVNK